MSRSTDVLGYYEVAEHSGGFGNVINNIIYGLIIAFATKRTPCFIKGAHSDYLQYLKPALGIDLHSSCPPGLPRVSYDGSHPIPTEVDTEVISGDTFNWTPDSDAEPTIWLKQHFESRKIQYDRLLACISHDLLNPTQAILEESNYLRTRTLRTETFSIGVHVRTSDREMALNQNVSERRKLVALEMGASVRSSCLTHEKLVERVKRLVERFESHRQATDKRQVTIFVAGDHDIGKTLWAQGSINDILGANVEIIFRKGTPLHSGRGDRSVSQHNVSRSQLQLLGEFFLLTEVDVFIPNCRLRCHNYRCGNTFAFNIKLRRKFFEDRLAVN